MTAQSKGESKNKNSNGDEAERAAAIRPFPLDAEQAKAWAGARGGETPLNEG